jgi:hypothetical protein
MSGGLASSRPLLRWLRQDPAWSRLPAALRARIVWQASWGSVNARLSQASDRHLADQPALQDPLLIVGPWRSGTTVMHELLTAATRSTTPLTWQCMNACAFELSTPHAAVAVLPRPMDGLEIRADSPQEDEFALLTLGVPSAYRAFWMPHRIGELHDTLSPAYWLADRHWLPVWERFLRGVLRSCGAAARQPLILKSPSHTYRLPAILRRYPSARVVWMARTASDVLASNRKMWRAMFDVHGLTRPDSVALDAFLAVALRGAAQVLAWCGEHLPSAQWCVVRHEALLTDPRQTVQAVCRQLSAGQAIDDAALARAVAATANGRVERYDSATKLDPISASAVQQLDSAQARY